MNSQPHRHTLDDLLSHANWMQGLARSLVTDSAAAEDLVQETWLRALRDPPARPGNLRSWLATVLRNVWREGGRRDRARSARHQQAAVPETLSSVNEQLERLELQRLLAAAVAELEEPFRSVIIWRYYEELSSAEIARRQSEPADRIRQRLHKAKQMLRERLRRDHGKEWSGRFAALLPLGLLTPRAVPDAVPAIGGPALLIGAASAVGLAIVVLVAQPWNSREPATEPPRDLPAVALVADAADEADAAPASDPELTRRPLLSPAATEALGFADVTAEATTGVLHGLVVAAEGSAPLPDVRVILRPQAERAPDVRIGAITGSDRIPPQTELYTDHEGAFRFDALEPGGYSLVFLQEGRVPQRTAVMEIEAGVQTPVHTRLAAGFETAVLVRCDGLPVPQAEVMMVAGDRDSIHSASTHGTEDRSVTAPTSGEGRAVLRGLNRGVYQVIVRSSGHATYRGEHFFRDARDARTVIEIELAKEGTLAGQVFLPGGMPAAGAHVFVNRTQPIRRAGSFYYRENGVAIAADGTYAIHGLPAADYYAVALLPDGSGTFHLREGKLDTVTIQAGQETRLDLHLPPPGKIHGRVVDSTGRPIPEVSVYVSWGDFKPRSAGFFQLWQVPGTKDDIHHLTTTDADGRFSISSLRASYEPLEFGFAREGYVRCKTEVTCPPDQQIEQEIELTALGATLSGSLTDEAGLPVDDIAVLAWEYIAGRRGDLFVTRSDEAGRFELSVPDRDSRFEVLPSLREYDLYVSLPERVGDVAAGQEQVDFVLRAKCLLEGTVLDAGGEVVHDFEVHLETHEPAVPDHDRHANRGQGRYRLAINPDVHRAAVFTAPGFAPERITSFVPSGTLDVHLTAAPDLGGVLVDAGGEPVAGALLCIATLDSKVMPLGSDKTPTARTDDRGRFLLRGVPEASEGNLLVAPGRSDAPALLHYSLKDLYGTQVQIQLPRSVPVLAEFVDSAGTALEGTVVVVDAEGWPLEPRLEAGLANFADVRSSERGGLIDGRVTFQLVPGDYWLVLLREGEEQRPFPLVVGAQAAATPSLFRVPN